MAIVAACTCMPPEKDRCCTLKKQEHVYNPGTTFQKIVDQGVCLSQACDSKFCQESIQLCIARSDINISLTVKAYCVVIMKLLYSVADNVAAEWQCQNQQNGRFYVLASTENGST